MVDDRRWLKTKLKNFQTLVTKIRFLNVGEPHEYMCGIYMDSLITNKIVLKIKEDVEMMGEVKFLFGWLQLVFN